VSQLSHNETVEKGESLYFRDWHGSCFYNHLSATLNPEK
jgi:hypothetical protein